MVIFIIFAPPNYQNRVKGYAQLLLCEAPKGTADHLTNAFGLATIFFIPNIYGRTDLDVCF